MNFPKNITIETCEKFLGDIVKSESTDSLQLPVGTVGYASSFGGLASAIQAINTWVRLSEGRMLSLSRSSANDEIEDLILRPHKFAAAMSAKSISFANESGSEIRQQVNAAAKSAIENQARSQFGQQRGGLCWFAFVDHSSKGFDPNFYIEKKGAAAEPRQIEQFKAVIKTMVTKAMAGPGGAKIPERDSLNALGRIFYELFLNTHEHGSRGESRNIWLKPGIRIIYVQGINLSRAGAENATESQPILSNYLASVADRNPTERQNRFVEIGIVDSGLGYCGRWLADRPSDKKVVDISIEEEYAIFKQCFSFRQTSTSKDSKGNGLPAVMDKLTELGGFMRVRSGRLALFRNFLSSPFVEGDPCGFYDWHSDQSAGQDLTSMPRASGVAISLLIPLEAK